VRASDWTRAVVVNHEQVVLGILDEQTLSRFRADPVTADSVMRVGPATVRAHEDLEPLVHRLHERDIPAVLVTDPDGRLLGVLVREDVDDVLSRQPATPG
jgi:Mg/Co/Ni transporter MgtE